MIDPILHLYMSNEEYIEYRMVNVFLVDLRFA